MSTFKSIRDRLGLTQAEMAKALGCSQGNVSFYERGQSVPPDAARRLIAHARTLGHNISFNDIYGDPAAPIDDARRVLSDQLLADACQPVLIVKSPTKKGA